MSTAHSAFCGVGGGVDRWTDIETDAKSTKSTQGNERCSLCILRGPVFTVELSPCCFLFGHHLLVMVLQRQCHLVAGKTHTLVDSRVCSNIPPSPTTTHYTRRACTPFTHTHTSMYACMHTHTYACMHTHTHTHTMYVHTHTHTLNNKNKPMSMTTRPQNNNKTNIYAHIHGNSEMHTQTTQASHSNTHRK